MCENYCRKTNKKIVNIYNRIAARFKPENMECINANNDELKLLQSFIHMYYKYIFEIFMLYFLKVYIIYVYIYILQVLI